MKITIIPKDKSREVFLDLFPPYLAKDLKPNWWTDLKPGKPKDSWILQHVNPENYQDYTGFTAKRCPAIQDNLSTGIVIPLWTKIYIGNEYDESGKATWTHAATTGDQFVGKPFLSSHMDFQFKGMKVGATAQGDILKIEMPYKIIVPKGYNILYTDPFYHFRDDIKCLTGMVEGDSWGYVSFPFSIENYNCVIEPGTPLVHAMIYKREEPIKLECRYGTEKEYKDIELDLKKFMLKEEDYRRFRHD